MGSDRRSVSSCFKRIPLRIVALGACPSNRILAGSILYKATLLFVILYFVPEAQFMHYSDRLLVLLKSQPHFADSPICCQGSDILPIRSLAEAAKVGGVGREGETRFATPLASVGRGVGHADRAGPLLDYCTGLLMPCERKSVEPIASRCPARAAAAHHSLLHFVG